MVVARQIKLSGPVAIDGDGEVGLDHSLSPERGDWGVGRRVSRQMLKREGTPVIMQKSLQNIAAFALFL